MNHINLKIPEHSYFFGFVQTDGSLTKSSRNRGKLQIELGEKAQQFMRYLYYPGCLVLKRKLKNVEEALKWKRPKTIKRIFKKFWEPKDDEHILNHSIEASCYYLKRTERSVKMRLRRLKNHKASYLDACLNKTQLI